MKKIFISTFAVMLVSFLAAPAFCLNAVVDVEKILVDYNKAREMNAQFERQNTQLRNYIINIQKQINDAKTPVEKKSIEDKYKAEVQKRTESLKTEQLQKVSTLEKEIYQAIDKVSGNKYEMVFVKNTVVKGGVDITQEVLNKLNSAIK